MTRQAAAKAYAQAGIKPSQLSVIELHGCCEPVPALFSSSLSLTIRSSSRGKRAARLRCSRTH